MSKPLVHAESDVRAFGGCVEDYLPIHNLMDSSKGAIADARHRALTHNSFFIQPDGILERIFGVYIINSDGRKISVRSIGERHILQDFGNKFIPTVQDWLQNLPPEDWMLNGKGTPPSFEGVVKKSKETRNIRDITEIIPLPNTYPPFVVPQPPYEATPRDLKTWVID